MVRLLFIVLLAAGVFQLPAQELPEELTGPDARAWIRANYYNSQFISLSYSEARRKMFAYVVNRNDSIECVYSGLKQYHMEGDESTAYPAPFNTEHVVPQSLFNSDEPMRSDIFILQPCYENWNNLRSNYMYRELDDQQTQAWIYLDQSTSQIPVLNIDRYSEYVPNGWEPRELKEGDVARAIMYFFTMYPQYSIGSVIDTAILCDWHEQDSVDAFEQERNVLTEVYQGNINPYIAFPHWANQAWGCDVAVPPVISGLQELDPNVIAVYPNPGKGRFTFELAPGMDYPVTLELIDARGRSDSSYLLSAAKETLDLDVPTGVYYLLVSDRNGVPVGYTSLTIIK